MTTDDAIVAGYVVACCLAGALLVFLLLALFA